MKLEPDPHTVQWLVDLVPDSEAFEWDRGNQAKNLKHGLTPEDIESVFWQSYVFAGRIAEPAFRVAGTDTRPNVPGRASRADIHPAGRESPRHLLPFHAPGRTEAL